MAESLCLREIRAGSTVSSESFYKGSGFVGFASLPEGLKEIDIHVSKRDEKDRLTFDSSGGGISPLDTIQYFGYKFKGKKLSKNDFFRKASKFKRCFFNPIYEVTYATEVYYLVHCQKKLEKNNISINLNKAEVVSNSYRYLYDKNNNLLFDNLQILSKSGGFLSNSEFIIHTDFKRFWSINFDSDDVISRIKNIKRTGISVEANLEFLMRILFFDLKLSLLTDVFFFNNLIKIPMVMHLPANAEDYVTNHSEVIYHWGLNPRDKNIEWNMPHYSNFPSKTKVKQILGKYCHSDKCKFNLVYTIKDLEVELDFVLSREIVTRGFYPRYFYNESKIFNRNGKEIVSFENPIDKLTNNGVLFNFSKLKEGNHRWHFGVVFRAKSENCNPSKGDQYHFRRVFNN